MRLADKVAVVALSVAFMAVSFSRCWDRWRRSA